MLLAPVVSIVAIIAGTFTCYRVFDWLNVRTNEKLPSLIIGLAAGLLIYLLLTILNEVLLLGQWLLAH